MQPGIDTLQERTGEPQRYCRKCTYPLAGLPECRCPECGTRYDPADARTYWTSKRQKVNEALLQALLTLAGFFALELMFAGLAYETVGEVYSELLIILVVLLNGLVALTLLLRRPRLSLVLAGLVALLIIPHQAYLGVRMVMLQSEAERIVRYAEDFKTQTGVYPTDLSGYEFRFEMNRRHLQQYTRTADGEFEFFWYIGDRGTSHRYQSKYRVDPWGYYPD